MNKNEDNYLPSVYSYSFKCINLETKNKQLCYVITYNAEDNGILDMGLRYKTDPKRCADNYLNPELIKVSKDTYPKKRSFNTNRVTINGKLSFFICSCSNIHSAQICFIPGNLNKLIGKHESIDYNYGI